MGQREQRFAQSICSWDSLANPLGAGQQPRYTLSGLFLFALHCVGTLLSRIASACPWGFSLKCQLHWNSHSSHKLSWAFCALCSVSTLCELCITLIATEHISLNVRIYVLRAAMQRASVLLLESQWWCYVQGNPPLFAGQSPDAEDAFSCSLNSSARGWLFRAPISSDCSDGIGEGRQD